MMQIKMVKWVHRTQIVVVLKINTVLETTKQHNWRSANDSILEICYVTIETIFLKSIFYNPVEEDLLSLN